jgi:Uma2 family endonuclease
MTPVWNPFAEDRMPVPVPVHRFTVQQYHEMIRTGILGEDDRVELIAGLIVDKMPRHPIHAGTVSILKRELTDRLPAGWFVRGQSPVTLGDSEPEPDLAVVAGPEERYLGEHPTAADVALIVEVAESSLADDRGRKLMTYAAAAIPVYWIVNLVELRVEVYAGPRPGRRPRYSDVATFGPEQGVPLTVSGKKLRGIPVARLLPAH